MGGRTERVSCARQAIVGAHLTPRLMLRDESSSTALPERLVKEH